MYKTFQIVNITYIWGVLIGLFWGFMLHIACIYKVVHSHKLWRTQNHSQLWQCGFPSESVICSHTLTSVMKSTVKASSQMHAVFLPLSVMNLSFTSPISTFGIRVNFLEAQTYVSFLRKYDANDNVIYSICSWYCYLSSVTGDNRWGWPRLCWYLPGWHWTVWVFLFFPGGVHFLQQLQYWNFSEQNKGCFPASHFSFPSKTWDWRTGRMNLEKKVGIPKSLGLFLFL